MSQVAPSPAGLSKAASKELPECINYVTKFNMSSNELEMYKLAAQHRLDKTPVYKTKHKAVLQAMIRAADIVKPSDMSGTSPQGALLARSGTGNSARSVSEPLPVHMTPPADFYQQQSASPAPASAVPGYRAAVPYPTQQLQRPSLLSPPPSEQQMYQLPASAQPTSKAKYKKKAQQQPIFLVTASKTNVPTDTTGYLPLGTAKQTSNNFKDPQSEYYASVEHFEHAPGRRRRSRRA